MLFIEGEEIVKQGILIIFVATVFCFSVGFIGQNQKAGAQQSKGMQWALKQMDEDDDGAISRSEAKGKIWRILTGLTRTQVD